MGRPIGFRLRSRLFAAFWEIGEGQLICAPAGAVAVFGPGVGAHFPVHAQAQKVGGTHGHGDDGLAGVDVGFGWCAGQKLEDSVGDGAVFAFGGVVCEGV